MKPTFLVRHGDVLVSRVRQIPKNALQRPHLVLAEGEMTGHAHRIAGADGAKMYQHELEMYLEVTERGVTLVHQEHGPIKLPQGSYRVWKQREYSPEEIRVVRD